MPLVIFCGSAGGLAHWLASWTTDKGVPGSRPGWVAVCCGLVQVTFTPCLVLVPGSTGRMTALTDCDGAGDYVRPNVSSPSLRDLVSRP